MRFNSLGCFFIFVVIIVIIKIDNLLFFDLNLLGILYDFLFNYLNDNGKLFF